MLDHQTVFRCGGLERGFTKIANTLLQNAEISDDTLGMLVRLLSRPANWEISLAGLITCSRSGRDRIYRRVQEAIALGFMRKEVARDGGRFARCSYIVTDNPAALAVALGEPFPAKPDTASPLPEKPDTENPPQQRKDSNKGKKEQNICGSLPQSASIAPDFELKSPGCDQEAKPRKRKTDQPYSATFEEFFAAYRKASSRSPGDKKRAWKEWQSLNGRQKIQAMAKIQAYMADCRQDFDGRGRPPLDCCRYISRRWFEQLGEAEPARAVPSPDAGPCLIGCAQAELGARYNPATMQWEPPASRMVHAPST